MFGTCGGHGVKNGWNRGLSSLAITYPEVQYLARVRCDSTRRAGTLGAGPPSSSPRALPVPPFPHPPSAQPLTSPPSSLPTQPDSPRRPSPKASRARRRTRSSASASASLTTRRSTPSRARTLRRPRSTRSGTRSEGGGGWRCEAGEGMYGRDVQEGWRGWGLCCFCKFAGFERVFTEGLG